MFPELPDAKIDIRNPIAAPWSLTVAARSVRAQRIAPSRSQHRTSRIIASPQIEVNEETAKMWKSSHSTFSGSASDLDGDGLPR
jgi:hypothetical protein